MVAIQNLGSEGLRHRARSQGFRHFSASGSKVYTSKSSFTVAFVCKHLA